MTAPLPAWRGAREVVSDRGRRSESFDRHSAEENNALQPKNHDVDGHVVVSLALQELIRALAPVAPEPQVWVADDDQPLR
jgi:hypothetical protein